MTAGYQAQEGGLSRPVGTGNEKRLAALDRKAKSGKYLPAAPDAGEIGRQKPHSDAPLSSAGFDCLEPREERPYKRERSAINTRGCRTGDTGGNPVTTYRETASRPDWDQDQNDLA